MAVTLEINESVPASWPVVATYLDSTEGEAPEVDAGVTWQRIEAWIRFRYPARSVVYLIDGPGAWSSPLSPFTASLVEVWQSDTWAVTTPKPSPSGGYIFGGGGPFRVTGTAGDDTDPPDAVKEAYRRLHEYNRGIAFNFRTDAAYIASGDDTVVAGYAAKSIQLSGAADLLRPYRRLAA